MPNYAKRVWNLATKKCVANNKKDNGNNEEDDDTVKKQQSAEQQVTVISEVCGGEPMQLPPSLTLDRLRAESKELSALSGKAQLQRLLQLRIPVFLAPRANCIDNSEKYSSPSWCCFTLISVDIVPKTAINMKKNYAGTFVLSVGNGKFYEIEEGQYCQYSCMRDFDKRGLPTEKGFLFDFVEQQATAEKDGGDNTRRFAIRSHFNGKWLRRDEQDFDELRADRSSVKKATLFALEPLRVGVYGVYPPIVRSPETRRTGDDEDKKGRPSSMTSGTAPDENKCDKNGGEGDDDFVEQMDDDNGFVDEEKGEESDEEEENYCTSRRRS